MVARNLDADMSLDLLKQENDYTEATTGSDADAQDLTPAFTALGERIDQVRIEQWRMWTAETKAQARVDASNARLDAVVLDLASELQYLLREHDHPVYRRYFPSAPSDIVRLGLESELGKVRSWPAALAGEPEPRLQAFADRVRAAIADGDAALEGRRAAGTARATHRLQAIVPLFDDVNAARRNAYGVLTQRGVERKRPARWADGFFRHGSAAHPGAGGSTPA